ncbi:MAG: hypothetical protein LBN04_04930 [Oscillospiraceae bacterium]|nr:hypothetical protein [Oscillospiraceae bacterium]
MKRIIVWLLMGVLLVAAPGGLAEGYAAREEAALQAAGLALVSETTLDFAGLPLLDEAANAALKSFCQAMRLRLQRQGDQGEGYAALDLLLQDQSVADLTLAVQDGVYYEQSNLLGGQTVAFTPIAFASFMPRLAERSGGALPPELDVLYESMAFALGGGDLTVDMDILNAWLAGWDAWRGQALTMAETAVPPSWMPGVFAARAALAEITREEMLALAAATGELLAPNASLWQAAAQAQALDDNQAAEILSAITTTIETLPDALAAWLPEGMPPMQYIELYDAEGAVISQQCMVALPDGLNLSLEWLPHDGDGLPPICLTITAADSRFQWRLSRAAGAPAGQSVSRITLTDPEFSFDATLTRNESTQADSRGETVVSETTCALTSDELLGAGVTATLHARTTDRASGAQVGYTRSRETALWLTGLGFDAQVPLTITTQTKAEPASPPLRLEMAVFPSTLPDEALDAWLENVRISTTQVLFTCLGRLPSDVAAYLLDRMP